MTQEKQYRYPGTRSFTENESALFFGRDEDIERLRKQIILEQLLVLFGKSGLGKSSLLNAGVLPLLKDSNKFLVIPLRIGLSDTQKSPAGLFLQKIGQIVEYTNMLWTKGLPDLKTTWENPQTDESFWLGCKSLQMQQSGKTILLVFDQFEELFSYKEEDIYRFAQLLATLLFGEMPQTLQNFIYNRIETDEYAFTPEENEILFKKVDVKVIISIRSDKMSLLDRLKMYIPQILQKTFELQPLGINQAKDVLLKPSQADGDFASPKFKFETKAIDKIINYLSSNKEKQIATFQLQLICQFCENLVISNLKPDNKGLQNIIKADDLGDLDTIFRRHYDNIISEIGDSDKRLAVRKLIEEYLITEGIRQSLSDKFIAAKLQIGNDLLQKLVESRLLSSEPNNTGSYNYEISHDSLIEPITESYKKRVEEEEKERKKHEEENKLRIANEKIEKERIERDKEKIEHEKERKQQKKIISIVSSAALISLAFAAFGIIGLILANQKSKNLSELVNKLVPENVKDVYKYALEQANYYLTMGDEKPYENTKVYSEAIKFFTLAKYSKDRPKGTSIKTLESQIDTLNKCSDLLLEANQYYYDGKFEFADAKYQEMVQKNSKIRTISLMREFCKSPKEHFMVQVEAGRYKMNNEFIVNVSRPFKISKYEITNAQFARFLNEYKSITIKEADTIKEVDTIRVINFVGKKMIDLTGRYRFVKCRIEKKDGKYVVEQGYDCFPVVYISWYGAYKYCRYYGGELPTEAQWEYAAAGGNKLQKNGSGIYSWQFKYAGSDSLNEVGWHNENSGQHEHLIGTLKANQLGILDMSGNAWEWCFDWFNEYPKGEFEKYVCNLATYGSMRVLRGGSFSQDKPCLINARGSYPPDSCFSNGGFRFVLNQ